MISFQRARANYSVVAGSALAFQRRVDRVPGQAGAFNPRRKFTHAGKNLQFADASRHCFHRLRIAGQHFVHVFKQISAAASVLPFSSAVIIEAEAFEIAQPEP